LLRVYPRRGGKLLRPVLCLAAVEAFGGEVESAARMAASLELLHNAFLVHDDLEDGSQLRRGEPALHVMLGPELAVHIGDALLARALSNAFLAASSSRVGVGTLAEVRWAVMRTEEGQALDILSSRDGLLSATAATYFQIVLKKTAAYSTVLPVRLGAAQAGVAQPRILASLTRFAMYCGVAFQVQDDLRSFGSMSANGKDPAGDLCEGKPTLPLLEFIARAPQSDRARLARFLEKRREDRGIPEARALAARIVASGSLESARRVAYVAAAAATHEWHAIERTLLPGIGRQALAALPEFALTHR
jgi:geranylgeranyl diphosphate synthase type II